MRAASARLMAAVLAGLVMEANVLPAQSPETELVAVVSGWLGLSHPAEWQSIERLPHIRWAPLPPTALRNCLPDGNCFSRQGTATIGGRTLSVVATGARTMVFQLYLRNQGTRIGEPAVLGALSEAKLSTRLARCPVAGGAGSTNWYRLTGGSAPGVLAIQAPRNSRVGEGFVLSQGQELPGLLPNQVALYSERCGEGEARAPVSTLLPHQKLARVITTLLPPAAGSGLDWNGLRALPTEMTWDSSGPKPGNLSIKNDPNPMVLTGHATYADRRFSLLASGTASEVKNIYLDEGGLHARGEHLLGVVYQQGIAVRLVRCGPVYTESTNNWYSLTSTRTRPAMIRQSIRYDGNQVQDSYELRLDGTLPPRDPRDRDPGVNGCQ